MLFRSKVAAHARSLKEDVDKALECGADFLGIFYCVSSARLDGVFKRSLADAIEQITGAIRYAREQSPDLVIRYTPEDTVRSKFENVGGAGAAAAPSGGGGSSGSRISASFGPVSGKSICSISSASHTALARHTGVDMQLPSATPLAPKGVSGVGDSMCRTMGSGTS